MSVGSTVKGILGEPVFDLRVSHFTLSVVRFLFFTVCFFECLQLYLWRHISFSESAVESFLGMTFSVPEHLMPMLLIFLVFAAVGFCTKFSLIMFYVLVFAVLAHTRDRYHFDYAMKSVGFVFLFMPRPQVLAIDRWIRPLKKPETLVPAWFVLMIFLGIELVYFDSLFYKFRSRLWMDGLAFWFPSALPHFSTGLYPEWGEIGWLMKFFAYLALFLETFFPLILLKRFRVPMFLIGFGLHMGIVLFFPIPFFGLGFSALYLLFIDLDGLVARVTGIVRPKLSEIPSAVSWKVTKIAGFGLCGLMVFSQCFLIASFEYRSENETWKSLGKWNARTLAKYMCIVRHPVYVDAHFRKNSPLLRWVTEIDGKEVEIPSFDAETYPHYPQVTGRYFVTHLFVLRKGEWGAERLHWHWERYLRGWFRTKGLEPRPVKVYYKQPNVNFVLDFTLDNQIRERPWEYGGEITFADKEAVVALESGLAEFFG